MSSITESHRCGQCSNEYSCKSSLTRHIKAVHTTPVLTDVCTFCSVAFASLTQLQQHAAQCKPLNPPAAVPLGPDAPLLVSSVDQTEVVADYIKWLGEPPLAQFEHGVKSRCKVKESQIKPERTTLLFLLSQALMRVPPGTTVDLRTLTQAEVVTSMLTDLEAKVKSERVYQCSLVLKKVCVYLCCRQSSRTKLYITPDHLSGWSVIASFAQKHCSHRKLAQRDRMVLYGEELAKKSMSPQELDIVLQRAMAELSRLEDEWVVPIPYEIEARYVSFFLTACLVLLFAPRQQILRELTTETVLPPRSPGNSSDQYVIKVSSTHSKISQPVLLRVPDSMTCHWTFYYRFILGASYSGSIFRQRGGGGRQDFTFLTKKVTDELLGRQVTAHQFRHAVATSFYRNPSSTNESMEMLAQTMNHSRQVQQSHYIYQDRLTGQARAQIEWEERLGITPQKRPRQEESKEEEEEEQKE